VVVAGVGVVSPAGWGIPSFRQVLSGGIPLAASEMLRPGWPKPLRVLRVPPPQKKPEFLSHPRLRRSSPISQFFLAAGLEALGEDVSKVRDGSIKLGIVVATFSGCVNYSRRFYDETLRDPASASPLVFPETVFNAPASHLAAYLGCRAINYTLVGDPGTFLQALAMAAGWIEEKRVDACLVLGAEEMDWLTGDAFRLFSRKVCVSEGAGALYLRPGDGSGVHLKSVTDSFLFNRQTQRTVAAKNMTNALLSQVRDHEGACLWDGCQDVPSLDRAETEAWKSWTGSRFSVKKILGEGLATTSAWQCVAAVDAMAENNGAEALVSVVGCNQQAIGALFAKNSVAEPV